MSDPAHSSRPYRTRFVTRDSVLSYFDARRPRPTCQEIADALGLDRGYVYITLKRNGRVPVTSR